MKSDGFTIVEIAITLTIMGILLVLGVVNLTGSQANGRDAKRKSDVETIAVHLENYYNSESGEYPPTTFISSISQYLPDLDTSSIMAPGISTPADTFKPAADVLLAQPTKDEYIYQPISGDGSLCTDSATQECRKFNIFYRLEIATDECPGFVCKVTSKHQ